MSTYPSGVMLPSELERRQIFYWLKRISFYTAWNCILGFYRAWAKVTEKSVQAASERGWLKQYDRHGHAISGVPTGERIYHCDVDRTYDRFTGSAIGENSIMQILRCLAHCEDGVRRLRRGDKRVFQYNAHGDFVMADRMLTAWGTQLYRLDIGENGIDEQYTPYWPEFRFALTQLNEAWDECGLDIIEPRDLDAPSTTFYGVWTRENLPQMPFPKTLPDIPEPVKHVLVTTGKTVPYSGIWEPVDVPRPKGFHLFGKQPVPEGPLPIIGCMAYLHGNSKAPQASLETADANPNADVTWRLLWRDDRYKDGTVPEEESEYVFQKPDPNLVAPEPEELRGGLRVWSDTPCPYPGVWQCLDKPLGPQTIAFGVPMPRVQGERVLWRLMKAV